MMKQANSLYHGAQSLQRRVHPIGYKQAPLRLLWGIIVGVLVPAFGVLVPAFGVLVPAFGVLVPAFGVLVPALGVLVTTAGCNLATAPMPEPSPTPTKTLVPAFGVLVPALGVLIPTFTSLPALPTITPLPSLTSAPAATATPERVVVAAPTDNPEPTATTAPTDTLTPEPTAAPTDTLIPTAPPPTATPIPTSTETAPPPLTATPIPTSTETAPPPLTDTPIPAPTAPPPPPTEPPPQNQAWDPQMPPEIQLNRYNPQEGEVYWKLIRAVVEDGSTPRTVPGDHHIYVELIRGDGSPVIGGAVLFLWNNTGDSAGYGAPGYSIGFPMSGGLGTYTVRVAGERQIEGLESVLGRYHPGLGDVIVGVGNRDGSQLSYLFTFQQTVHHAVQPQPPSPDWEPNVPPQVRLYPAQVESGQTYWKLMRLDFEDYDQPHNVGGDHQVYVMTIDENGQAVPMGAHFKGGGIDAVMDHLDMFGSVGSYSAQIPGEPSDIVAGLGMRGNYHVSYILTFQRVVRQ